METISITKLKAHLSATLKWVRTGNNVIILDRDVPVARITPYPGRKEGVVIRRAVKKKMAGSLRLGVRLDFDPVSHLLEERRKGRL